MTFESHPAAALFPMMEGDEFDALVADIRANGQIEPVWVTVDGLLVDGRNRARACEQLGLEVRTQTYTGDDPIGLAIGLNLSRRHLNTGQRAFIALSVEEMYAAEAAKNVGGRPPKPVADLPQVSESAKPQRAPVARERAAKAAKTSGRAVGQAKRVQAKAPDLAEKVKSGELALDRAEKQVARREAEVKEQEARTAVLAPVATDAAGDRWRMFTGDFRDRLHELPDACVDLIITDPPYPREFLHLWGDLAKHAARLLRPQGVLVGMTGQIMLPEVLDALGAHLQYGWVYNQPLPGANSRIMARHVLQAWKPWVAYSNGPWPSGRVDWHSDVLDPSTRAKDRYRWEQDPDPAKMLIDALSPDGGMVLDPFAGTGSYGVAALSMGREFIGCELDTDRFTKASERVGKAA